MEILADFGHITHGLVYFSLGLILSFLRYRSKRIELTRQLSWLRWFAVCETLVGWSPLVIKHILPNPEVAYLIRPAVLGIGYTFLAAFGLQTFFDDEPRRMRVQRALIVTCIAWVVIYGGLVMISYPQIGQLRQYAELLARIGLGLPGGLLTAYGLRRRSYRTLEPELRNRIRASLRLVEIMMAAFGVLSLVLAPFVRTLWFGHNLTGDIIESFCGWLRAAIGLGITLGFTGTLTSIQREIEKWVEGVERLQTLAVDRDRIGRELHDGIIQSIYAVGLLIEGILPVIPKDPPRAQAQLVRVMDSLNNTIQDIRRYIFDLRSDMADDTIPAGIERLLRDFRINTLLETELEITGTFKPITSMERRRHILQIVREALANTARHAQARWVKINLRYSPDALDIIIADDGIGMETLQVSKGYGLRNIRERVRLLEGTLRIESAPGEGVTFNLTVPY